MTGTLFDSAGNPEVLLFELWKRNPIAVVQHILGNPALEKHMHWVPEKVYVDESRAERIYNEAWTSDHWFELQVRIYLISHYEAYL